MVKQQEILYKWKSSASKAFWGVLLISFAGIISTIYDYVSYVVNFIEFVTTKMSSMLDGFGGGRNIPSIDLGPFFAWGFSSKGLVIIGYILYLWGLTSFAAIQDKESSIRNVKKVRSATILLIITFLLNIVFGVLSIVPFAGTFFGLIIWVLFLICFYKMRNAFGKLMVAENFSQRAQRGARNLRYAACCEIRLRWLPLVTGIIIIVVLIMFIMIGRSAKSLQDLESIAKIGGIFVLVVLLFSLVIALFAMFCAFWWPIIGWYRIKTGGPSSDEQKRELDKFSAQKQEIQEDAPLSAAAHNEQLSEVKQNDEAAINGGMVENRIGWYEKNKRWVIPLVIVIMLLLLLGVFLGFEHKGEFAGKPISELFPEVQKTKDSGTIPDIPTIYEWDVSQGEECGGDVTVVRKADENQMVIMYETTSCDANILRLGIYQNGQYVFYYELPVGNLEYDETKYGISLHADLPESTIYYGYYGKDMAKSIEHEWGVEHPLDWNKVSETQLAELFQNALNDGPKGTPYILTYNEIKANMDGAAINEDSRNIVISGFSYLVGNAESGLDLYVDVDNRKIPTGISGTAETLDIIHQNDYDGDGEKEALVYEWGGGNAAYPPYIVYYDKKSQSFKKAEGFETIFGESDVVFEYWKGKQSILVKTGLETSRYVFENHQVKKVESKMMDMGPELATYTCKELFTNSSEEEIIVNLDLNDDGLDEKLIFVNNDSHAFDYGNAMMLEKIIWADGTETFGCHQVASSFIILKSMTAGVHDMITNGRQLQKWTGEEYDE